MLINAPELDRYLLHCIAHSQVNFYIDFTKPAFDTFYFLNTGVTFHGRGHAHRRRMLAMVNNRQTRIRAQIPPRNGGCLDLHCP